MQPGEGCKYLEWVTAEGEVAECGLGGMCPGRKLGWRAGLGKPVKSAGQRQGACLP